jgi:hypothetical protein
MAPRKKAAEPAPEPIGEWVGIDTIKEWDKNPRRNDHAVEGIADSIKRFGWGSPILARRADRVVIGGHTRLKAARLLKMDKVPVRWMDLDPAQAAALALADNKLGEIAEWDDEGLRAVLAELEAEDFDLDGLGWDEEALAALLEDGEPEPGDVPDDIDRHKTAMTRPGLSAPLQALIRYGYLDGSLTLFDYGCGKGDDLRAAVALGVKCAGFDPHFLPGTPTAADCVLLSFVLNVIEDPDERDTVARAAFAQAARVLCVGLIQQADGDAVGDGLLTSAGTFQKTYTPEEGEAYLRGVLGADVEWIGRGVALVFPSASARNDFEYRKQELLDRPLSEVIA